MTCSVITKAYVIWNMQVLQLYCIYTRVKRQAKMNLLSNRLMFAFKLKKKRNLNKNRTIVWKSTTWRTLSPDFFNEYTEKSWWRDKDMSKHNNLTRTDFRVNEIATKSPKLFSNPAILKLCLINSSCRSFWSNWCKWIQRRFPAEFQEKLCNPRKIKKYVRSSTKCNFTIQK